MQPTDWRHFILKAHLKTLENPHEWVGNKGLQLDYLTAEKGWIELEKGNTELWAKICQAYSIPVPWHKLMASAYDNKLAVNELSEFINLLPQNLQFKVIDLTLNGSSSTPYACPGHCAICKDECNK